MKTKNLIIVVICTMIAQIVLYALGVISLFNGSLVFGTILVTVNSSFFVVNIYTIKRCFFKIVHNGATVCFSSPFAGCELPTNKFR